MTFAKKESGTSLFVTNLEANSYYAFYVKAYVVEHTEAKSGISKVVIARTLFARKREKLPPDYKDAISNFSGPPYVKLKSISSPDPTQIKLTWIEPPHPKGVNAYYKLLITATRSI